LPRELLAPLVFFAIGAVVVLAEFFFPPTPSLTNGALMAGAGALVGGAYGAAGSMLLRDADLLSRWTNYVLFSLIALVAVCWAACESGSGHGTLGGCLGALFAQGFLHIWRK
jgi:hypothetical protein